MADKNPPPVGSNFEITGAPSASVDNDLLNPSRKEAMNKLRNEVTLRIWRSIPGNVENREQEGNIELGDHLEKERTSNIETDIEE
ncbi:hypothetical protein OROMI_033937 [Orobanche minor]